VESADELMESNEEAQKILLQAQYESLWNEDWFAGGFYGSTMRKKAVAVMKNDSRQGKLAQKQFHKRTASINKNIRSVSGYHITI
jgi:hypothetical protein